MNRNAKRAVTLLIILTMVTGMFPAMGFAVAGDLAAPVICHDETDPSDAGTRGEDWGQDVDYDYDNTLKVQYGNTLAVIEGQSGQMGSGSIIAVYWDYMGAWDDADKEGYLNETEATSAGNYEVWLDVPEGVYGSHYIWVKNLDSGDYAQTEVIVIPKVSLSPGSGQEDDRIEITGRGLKKDKETAFLYTEPVTDDDFFNIPCQTVTGEVLNTVPANEIEGDLLHTLIKPGTVHIDAPFYTGLYELVDYNTDGAEFADGNLYEIGTDTKVGEINYITGEYDIDYDGSASVLAEADYCYFAEVAGDVFILDTGGDTSDLGTVIDKEDVPDTARSEPYEMWFWVYDETGKHGGDDFTVGATISVEPDVVKVGEIMTIRGKGFSPNKKILQAGVTIERGTKVEVMELKSGDDWEMTDGNGEFRFNVIVPQVFDDKDDFEVVVCDEMAICADSGDVEVTDLAEVEVDPEYGSQGRTVMVTGTNFANVREYDYTIYYRILTGVDAGDVEELEDVESNSRGEISEEITIPASYDGDYEIFIEDDGEYISAKADFRIGSILVLLSKDSAPSGTEIIMTGNGFTPNGNWNATFGDLVLYEDEGTGTSGLLEEGGGLPEWFVPQVEPGTYTITVTDMENDISVDVPFEVTKTTYVELNANNVPNEFNLTFAGYFWAETGGDIDMELYNDTDWWTIDPLVMWDDDDDDDTPQFEDDAFKWDDDANFTCYWEIFDDETLDKGDYTINITDDEDFLIQITLTIGDKIQSIVPRKSSFAIGEQVAFDIMHSFKLDDESYVKIFDPDSELYWRMDDISGWEREGPYYWVPYAEQTSNGNEMWLLEDAPLGEWSFTWYEDDGDKLESGTFSVTESPGDVLSGQIEDVNAAIEGLQDDIQGVSDDMTGLQGDIADAVSAANAATSAANAAVDAVNAIAATAGDAAEAAQAASEAADEARKAAGGLTTLVYGAIGASLVAALAAIVSLMQISRRIAG